MTKLEDLKKLDKREIYSLIRKFDLEVQEDFIDYNENLIKNTNIAFYLLGKRIISQKNINEFIENKYLTGLDLDNFLNECGITNFFEKRILISEITINFDTVLKKIINSFKEHKLDFTVNEDIKNKIKKEMEYKYENFTF